MVSMNSERLLHVGQAISCDILAHAQQQARTSGRTNTEQHGGKRMLPKLLSDSGRFCPLHLTVVFGEEVDSTTTKLPHSASSRGWAALAPGTPQGGYSSKPAPLSTGATEMMHRPPPKNRCLGCRRGAQNAAGHGKGSEKTAVAL